MSLNEKQKYTIFTVCNLAYLPRALVLAEFVLKYNNIKLNICIFDRKIADDFSAVEANIFWIEDMGIPNLYQLAFKYDIIELSTSLKPYITLQLLDRFEKVIFLDPDTCLYNSVEPILDDLDQHSIILTPHYTTPLSNHSKLGWNNDLGMMRFGSFNLGFYAVRNSPQGLDFLRWWSDRCLQFGFMETQFGLSADQKWVSIAPSFFKELHISFNLGYNVAPWNIFERCIKKTDHARYIVNDIYPLIFFHFSNFDGADPEYLKERSLFQESIYCPGLLELGMAYRKALSVKKLEIPLKKYGFDYMSGGEYISPTLRRAYASILNELPHNHDPFDSNGVVGNFARKNYLFETKTKVEPKKTIGFQDIGAHKNKLRFIYFLMRMVLRLIGPNKFQDLSRLMVFLSSYRQNRGLWKY
jgi:Nucleotide-diphospho-sugar transferase